MDRLQHFRSNHSLISSFSRKQPLESIRIPESTEHGHIRRTTLYAISYVAASPGNSKRLKEGRAANPPLELSHICGNSGCINPDHLALESHAVNMSRDACHARGVVEFNGMYLMEDCPHHPPCLRTRLRKAKRVVDIAEEFVQAGKDFL